MACCNQVQQQQQQQQHCAEVCCLVGVKIVFWPLHTAALDVARLRMLYAVACFLKGAKRALNFMCDLAKSVTSTWILLVFDMFAACVCLHDEWTDSANGINCPALPCPECASILLGCCGRTGSTGSIWVLLHMNCAANSLMP
jgi:hypothetical protein